MEILSVGDTWVIVRSSDGQLWVIHANEDTRRVNNLMLPKEREAKLQARERQLRFTQSNLAGHFRRRNPTQQLLREKLNRKKR